MWSLCVFECMWLNVTRLTRACVSALPLICQLSRTNGKSFAAVTAQVSETKSTMVREMQQGTASIFEVARLKESSAGVE